MDHADVINLFSIKPRHAGRLLAEDLEIKACRGDSVPEKAYNFCYPGSAEKFNGCLACHRKFKNFISFNQGYRHYCSPKCSNGADLVKQHKKLGMLKKYGVENPLQDTGIKARAQATNLERYGSVTPLQQDHVQEKVRNTLRARHGVDHAFKLDRTKLASQAGKQRTYSTDLWPSRLEFIEKECEVTLVDADRSYEGPYHAYSWRHKCGHVYESAAFSGRVLACPKCKVTFRSKGEEELAQFIKLHVPIVELNDRQAVRPYELDVYCPELKLAVEYNGIYWHSDEWKQPDYHLKKLLACQRRGIRLIQIFEDEWSQKPELVKSRLSAILGKAKRIYARHCEVREVEPTAAKHFLVENHLQGACGAAVKLGLYLADRLVALMTFGKPRFNSHYDWELLRYCTAIDTTVLGGPSRLLKAFKQQATGTVISYADRRWSEGDLYRKLGFTEIEPSPPSYAYLIDGRRINRVSAQKHKLGDLLGVDFDPNKTELENMSLSGYRRVYDCGNLVFTCTL